MTSMKVSEVPPSPSGSEGGSDVEAHTEARLSAALAAGQVEGLPGPGALRPQAEVVARYVALAEEIKATLLTGRLDTQADIWRRLPLEWLLPGLGRTHEAFVLPEDEKLKDKILNLNQKFNMNFYMYR